MDLASEIARWRTTQASELFAKFVRNNIAVDPTLSAQDYIVRRLASGQPDPNERYIAQSALRESEKSWTELRRNAAAFVAGRSPVLREMQAVTALMHRSNVMLIAGTDTSFIHPSGFMLHDELQLLVDAGLSLRRRSKPRPSIARSCSRRRKPEALRRATRRPRAAERESLRGHSQHTTDTSDRHTRTLFRPAGARTSARGGAASPE